MIAVKKIRKPKALLAFVAGFFGLGLGYVYVGKIRLALATIASLCLTVSFFAWTRLLVQSAAFLWGGACLGSLITLIALIHPILIAAQTAEVPTRRYNRWWFYLLWSLVSLAIGPAILASRRSALGYETFSIPSESMSPTVQAGDFVMTDSWRYRNHAVAVGDIVIIERPERLGVKYIKRVVAVGGDSIEIRDGSLYRNDQLVEEPYVHPPVPFEGSPRNVPKSTLGSGLLYVLGDFRDNSMDSRQWGPFPTSSVSGRVQFIWLSLKGQNIRWERIGISLLPP